MKDAYVEINTSAIGKNIRNILQKYSNYDSFIAVVKGDAYGHGFEIVNTMHKNGIEHFAVSTIDEAAGFRQYNTAASLLCLEPVAIDMLDKAKEYDLTIVIPSLEYLNSLITADPDCSLSVHIQLDCGFNRLGIKDEDELVKAFDIIQNSCLKIEGIYQHYATAGVFDPHFDNQARRFEYMCSKIDISKIPLVHMGSGVALLGHKKPDIANTTRMGLLMYGYNISVQSYGNSIKDRIRSLRDKYYQRKYNLSEVCKDVKLELESAMSMHCRILQIKNVSAGEHIGYNASYTAQSDMKIAVLPVGYANGIGHANNRRKVLINSKLYPVVGEVGMNMICVQIDDTVKESDRVTLLGDKLTLGMFCRGSGMGLAEALVSVGTSNERIYTK